MDHSKKLIRGAEKMTGNNEKWSLVLRPKTDWLEINYRELWKYRDLVILFIKRDFVTFYKQTILGPIWYVLQPLMSTIAFTVVFGRIAGLSTDGLPQPLFYMSGIVVWSYFSDALTNTSNTFLQNTHIFSKIYFPRLLVPISVVFSSMIKLTIQFGLFVIVFGYYWTLEQSILPSPFVFLLPLLFFQMAALSLGCGILISSMTTKYRDLNFVISFGVQLWMYATPIVYPLSQVPDKYRLLFDLNPMTAIVTNFRYLAFSRGQFDVIATAASVSITLIILMAGTIFFNRVEKNYLDTI